MVINDNKKIMKKVITTEKRPIKLWLEDMEDWALEQAKNLANLPFLYKHIAIMPDSHQGFWMPIGWVMATKWVVIPNAVWVDIWCWMCAVKTSLTNVDEKTLKKIMSWIREAVPVGFNKHKEEQDVDLMPNWTDQWDWIVADNFSNALKSLWTLWGWNHFIEIQKWDDWYIWIMIHSWSRNLWLQVAKHYNNLAKELNKQWFAWIDPKHDLAFLPLNSEEWKAYINEMNYCVDFAFANRKLMLDRIKKCFVNEFNDIEFDEIINIAHNYARFENHWDNVMVHRKGATSAREWEIGIIPWSQWTNSYIVEGLWNKESFESCSHWAGRKLWRKKAQQELNLEDEIKRLDDMWVIHSIRTEKDLDEASWAYKDIDEVMKNQEDLVKIKVKLTPLAVIKW